MSRSSRPSFSAKLGVPEGMDNHKQAERAKVDLREHLLEGVRASGAGAHVFEAYAGSGVMHRAVWSRADTAVGCDLRWFRDHRSVYVGDCRHVMRVIPLEPFNIFDLDSYGSPWDAALIVAARRRFKAGELLGIALTCGSWLRLKFGSTPRSEATLTGIESGPGLFASRDLLNRKCLDGWCKRVGAKVERLWQAKGKSGAGVIYLGALVRVQPR